MSQLNALELARHGNPQAIAALMNRALQPKGITAKAKLAGECLQVLLESEQATNQKDLVAYICKGVRGLDVKTIRTVAVYGLVRGEAIPIWAETVSLAEVNLLEPRAQSTAEQSVQSEVVHEPAEVQTAADPEPSLTSFRLSSDKKDKGLVVALGVIATTLTLYVLHLFANQGNQTPVQKQTAPASIHDSTLDSKCLFVSEQNIQGMSGDEIDRYKRQLKQDSGKTCVLFTK
ncbi:MAG: hypothetical protein ACAF41_12470 [Leptolyngbya sp. BL-A-14]